MNTTARGLFSRTDLVQFFLVVGIGVLFAIYTQHIWEDGYINYRSSKNLALGYGLVYNPGEHVQTFSSPLNALLPAMLIYVTGNHSDELVLWLHRLISLGCLGVAALLMRRVLARLGYQGGLALLALGLFIFDVKNIDYSINGMEIGFVLLFWMMSLYALFRQEENAWLWSGVSWAAFMWTRPDACIEIGASALAVFIFAPELTAAKGRKQLLVQYFKAGLMMLVLYAPWLIWTTYYYGSPIPHTIVAKGLFLVWHFRDAVVRFFLFPWIVLFHPAFGSAFAPVNYFFGGWPASLTIYYRVLEWLCLYVWLLPGTWRATRIFSFIFLLGNFYLLDLSFPYNWYYPQVSLAGVITLTLLIGQLLELMSRFKLSPAIRLLLMSCPVVIQAGVFCLSSYEIKLYQSLVEDGIRKPLGLWLHAHAQPKDTVFMESLGYIGYFSELKTYDFPGISSPEMVAARRAIGPESFQRWGLIIDYLKPDWLVLRNVEAYRIHVADEALLKQRYQFVGYWSAEEELHKTGYIPGLPFLENDAVFLLYHKKMQ